MGMSKTIIAAIMASMGNESPKTFGVTLSSVVGGLPASDTGIVSINQVVAPNIIVPVITAHRTTGVAPLAITFDALATTAPLLTARTFSEIHYEWRFGDDRGTYWSYGVNAGGNNKNIAFGPVAAHVFETSGTFTVELIASHINSAGQLSQTTVSRSDIVVTNADTVFTANTIYISQSGVPVPGEGGVPPGANVQQVTAWSTVATLAQTYKRILLKRGDNWTGSTNATLNAAHAGPGIIGAYGTGDRPTITTSAAGDTQLTITTGAADWRVMDVVLTGLSMTPRIWSVGFNANHTSNILLLRTDVKMSDVQGVYLTAVDGIYMADSVFGPSSDNGGDRTYSNYGNNLTRAAMLGCHCFGASSHTLRWQGADRSVISNSHFDQPRELSYARVTVRGKTNDGDNSIWNGLWSEYNVISDNYIDSGDSTYTPLNNGPMNSGSAERLRFMLVERNFILSQANGMQFSIANGLTVRNNIGRVVGGNFVHIDAVNTAGSPHPSDGWIYNNSFAQFSPVSPWGSGISVHVNATGQVLVNNLMHAPGSEMNAISGTEGVQWTGSNNTTTAQLRSVTSPYVVSAPVNAADFAPTGYPVDAGARVPVRTNYFGSPYGDPRNMGAI